MPSDESTAFQSWIMEPPPEETIAESFVRRFYHVCDDTNFCTTGCSADPVDQGADHLNLMVEQQERLLAEAREEAATMVKFRIQVIGRQHLGEWSDAKEKFIFPDGSAALSFRHCTKYDQIYTTGDCLEVARDRSENYICLTRFTKHLDTCPARGSAESLAASQPSISTAYSGERMTR